MKKATVVNLGLMALLIYAGRSHSGTLCRATETLIFNCEMAKEVSSLCRAKANGTFTYRNGKPGEIKLEVASPPAGRTEFRLSSAPYAGGGEAHIRFTRFRYTYILYDRTVKTADGPEFSAGVVVLKDGRMVSKKRCANDASILADAYELLPREEFHDLQDTAAGKAPHSGEFNAPEDATLRRR